MRLAALTLLLCGFGPQQAEIVFEKDIVYGKGGGEDLKLNLAKPKK